MAMDDRPWPIFVAGVFFVSRASSVLPLFVLLLVPLAADADRERVLAQIDVPHDYYFREMYLPLVSCGRDFVGASPAAR
jgi:hypothetical protein